VTYTGCSRGNNVTNEPSMTFAFDVGWWGSALGHPAFTNYYGQLTKANGTHALSPTQQSCGT
jgi:hypothetical protein